MDICFGTLQGDMTRARAFWDAYLSDSGRLPVTFTLGGRAVDGIPSGWKPAASFCRIDANLAKTVYSGRDPETGLILSIECLRYLDFPVVEWVAWLQNDSAADTPVIASLRACDTALSGASPWLWSSRGDTCEHQPGGGLYAPDGYSSDETPLPPGDSMIFAPKAGLACNHAFPYFRVRFPDGGCAVSVGWPAQWEAAFNGTADGVRITAGQQRTRMRLRPGEMIRTPRMTLLFWEGGERRGINLWRRWYFAHILPRPDGRPVQPALINGGTEGYHTQITNFNSTEENQIRLLRKHKAYGYDLDIWWHDAGWYVRRDVPDWFPKEDWPAYAADNMAWSSWQWWRVGTWEVDPDRFPNGMLPVSREAERLGVKFLLWFEPERVYKGTRLWKEHPKWLLSANTQDTLRTLESSMLNLGDPACVEWLTDFLCDFIRKHGIKIYRQDFNIPPLPYWIENEAEDRQGFLENRHVQGYLKLWDALLERNPGLSIDSCAAGGRRNDLETMRRSVPYLKSDYGYDVPADKRAFHQTLYQWIPYFAGHAIAKRLDDTADYTWKGPENQFDSYAFHSAMCPALALYMDINDDSFDHDCGRKMVSLWRRAAPYIECGDFYPLSGYSKSPASCSVFQFETPEARGGVLHALCHEKCGEPAFKVFPAVSFPEDIYRFENPETGEKKELTGKTLIEHGFPLSMAPRTGALWFYLVVRNG